MQSLWMLFAAFVFAIMGVCVKLASARYSTSEIVMYRGLIGVVFMYILITLRGGTLRTGLPGHHLWRGIAGSVALWLWFYSMGKLPLATAMTLNYMSSIWIAALVFSVAWWRGSKRFAWGLALAIAISFAGVVLLLQPTMIHAEQSLAGLLGLISGVLTALAYLQVRHLGQLGEPEYRVVFYFSLTGMTTGLIGMAVDALSGRPAAAPLSGTAMEGMMLVLGIGICATIAQLAMTRAYRLGRVLVTANLQYTGIVFASIWGILLWHDTLTPASWLGMGIILASGCAATYYNARSQAPRNQGATN